MNVKIEFFWYEHCPSHTKARSLLNQVIDETGVHAEITETQVKTQEYAEALAFPGSPTIRINGADIDPTGATARPALTCRTYVWDDGRYQPLPEKSKLVSAILNAADQ